MNFSKVVSETYLNISLISIWNEKYIKIKKLVTNKIKFLSIYKNMWYIKSKISHHKTF